MVFRNAEKEDISAITSLAKNREITAAAIEDLLKYPGEVAVNIEGELLGFALCQELGPDVLLVQFLAVKETERAEKTGRSLLELVESKAADRGYYNIVLSGFVQETLMDCQGNLLSFAGYSEIYATIGGSRLLAKSIN